MTIELTKKYISGYKLKELTLSIIQQYYDKLDRAEKTVVVVTAKKQRLITDNYAGADYITFPNRPFREIDYMDDEDAKKFYRAADEYHDIRYKTAMLTLLLT